VLGLGWHEAPASLEESALRRLASAIDPLIERHDWVYIHLRVASADVVQRQCAMERMDQLILKPLTERLPAQGPWRLFVAVDDWRNGVVPFVALGTGLPQQGIPRLTAEAFAESRLTFDHGPTLLAWFMAQDSSN
jgi:hypothetical protein